MKFSDSQLSSWLDQLKKSIWNTYNNEIFKIFFVSLWGAYNKVGEMGGIQGHSLLSEQRDWPAASSISSQVH